MPADLSELGITGDNEEMIFFLSPGRTSRNVQHDARARLNSRTVFSFSEIDCGGRINAILSFNMCSLLKIWFLNKSKHVKRLIESR